MSETSPVESLPLPLANPPACLAPAVRNCEEGAKRALEYRLTLGEHTGTHLVAPTHWITGRNAVDVTSIPPSMLIGPACVIDKTAETEADPGYLLTVDDLEAWESAYGEVPPGRWILLGLGGPSGLVTRRHS